MTNTPPVVAENGDISVEVETAWRAISLWPLRLERWTGERWYLLVGVPLLVWGVSGGLVVLSAIHYKTKVVWFLAYAGVLGFGLGASGLAFRLWYRRFIDTFPAMVRGRSLRSVAVSTDECFRQLTSDYQRYLHSRWRYLMVCVVVASTSGTLFVMVDARSLWAWFRLLLVYATRNALTVEFYASPLLAVSQIVVFVLWSYAVAAAAWVLSASGYLLWRLPKYFDLHVVVSHPDRCGGLRAIGSCCLGIAYPLAIGLIVLCVWAILGSHATLIRRVSVVAALLFVIPMTITAFFWPLWQVHRALTVKRDAYAMTYAAALEFNLARLAALAESDDDAAVKLISDRVTGISATYPTQSSIQYGHSTHG